ncbi:hypothetical protein ACOSQ4_000952 [Xanthoceras sorbifolium]
MATTSLLRANRLLFSNRRQNFHGNHFNQKNHANTAAFPFNIEEKTSPSIPKGNIYEEGVISFVLKTLKWLKVPAVVVLLLFVTMYGRDPALVAPSGGVMGGRSFSSSSSKSSFIFVQVVLVIIIWVVWSFGIVSFGWRNGQTSFSSSSSSKPSSSSSPSRPSSSSSSSSWESHNSSPSRQYSSSTSYDDNSYESSSSSPIPDWYYSSSYYTSSLRPSATQHKPFNGLNQGVAGTKYVTAVKTEEQPESSLGEEEFTATCIWLTCFILSLMYIKWVEARENPTRVNKLQVGLHALGPSFEESINRIAETADTSNSKTTKTLRHHLLFCIAVNSSSVTILVAAKGKAEVNFPSTIASIEDLKKVFQELESISKSANVQAVNVLWTPEDENEVTLREELYQIYPLLCEVAKTLPVAALSTLKHISKPQVRKENTFEQTAVIPEEKDACRTTVIKLQVGLHVHGPSFEESINRIADNADTSNSSGLIYILNETTETLLNHFMSWIAVNSSVKVSESIEDAENYFKRISIEEREKFDRETLAVNVLWSPQDGNKPSSSGGSPLLYPPRQLLASSVLGRVGDHRANRSFSSLEGDAILRGAGSCADIAGEGASVTNTTIIIRTGAELASGESPSLLRNPVALVRQSLRQSTRWRGFEPGLAIPGRICINRVDLGSQVANPIFI